MVNKSYGTNACYLWESYFLRDTGTAVVKNPLMQTVFFLGGLVEGPFSNDIEARLMEGVYPHKTNMTGWKIHHEWRCISYWTKGIFQPVVLVFRGLKLLRSSNRFTCHPASLYRRRKSSIGWKNLGFFGMDGDSVWRAWCGGGGE